jgi:hypothetical protein
MSKKQKPVYRSSNLIHYFTCPQKYKLSLEYPIEQNDAMREGLLFEGYVFGKFKEDNEKDLIGKKHTKTIDEIKKKAEYVKPYFDKGEAFKLMKHETDEYILQGECDFVGTVNYQGEKIKAIADLKFTGDIHKNWEYLTKEKCIQSALYPYLYFKITGERLPFIYIVVENKYNTPIVKLIKVETDDKDFEWIQNVIDKVHNDLFYYANVNIGTCINGYYGRCDFVESCKAGREFIAQPVIVNFGKLNEI